MGRRREGEELARRVARSLDGAGIDYESQPSIGGLRPDFLIHGPEGETVVVETKAWPPDRASVARAIGQAEHYKRVTSADHAFLVLRELRKDQPERGVVNDERLVGALTEFFARSGRGKARRTSKKGADAEKAAPARKDAPRNAVRRTVFAAMPFKPEYDDTFFVAMAHAAEEVDAACSRVDRSEFSGDVVEEIRRQIRASVAVIVDLSESKPNVLYEAGFAHALGKPAVHICSTPLDALPFDVRNWNTLQYVKGGTSALRAPLARRLRSVLKG